MHTFQRQHPLSIMARISHFLILLILPVLRGLLFSGGNLYVWLSGAWIDLLVVSFIILLGYIGWFFDLYLVNKEGIYVYTGIFSIRRDFIPLEEISTVSLETPWYFSPFHAARLHADTAAGNAKKFDFSILLNQTEAQRIVSLLDKNKDQSKQNSGVYHSNLLTIAMLSLISSNSFTGVLFVSTLLSQGGKLFGVEFERYLVENLTILSHSVTFGIPPITVFLSLLALLGWLVAFVLNVVRYARFNLLRRQNTLLVRTGAWINRRTYLLDVRLANLVEIRQTLLTKIFGFYSIYLDCIGYGKSKNERNVFIPAASRGASLRVLTSLLPELPLVRSTLRPHRSAFGFFLTVPLSMILINLAILFSLLWLFPQFFSFILFVGVMLEILFGLYLTMRIFSYFHTGIGIRNGRVTVQYTHGFLFSRISLPIDKLTKVHYRQTPFQKRKGCCTLVLYTFSEKRHRHLVPNVNLTQARALLNPELSKKAEPLRFRFPLS